MMLSVREGTENRTMSLPPSATDYGPAPTDAPAVLTRLGEELRVLVEAVFFWAAIVLPFLHVSLLLAGVDTTAEATAFAGLLGLNMVALVVGHRHRRG
jgi:hypothetical protein